MIDDVPKSVLMDEKLRLANEPHAKHALKKLKS